MQVEIYADVVFAINFIMDTFIFWIVSKLNKEKTPFLRLLAGGFIAAGLYCMLIFIPIFQPFYNIFASIFILMASLVACFRPKRLKEFLKLIFFAHMAAFSIGGLSIALFYYTNIGFYIGNMLSFTVHNFSFKVLLAGACLAYVITKLSIGWFRRIMIKKQACYPVRVYFGDGFSQFNALVDTGNTLHEPISQSPVIITEFKAIQDFLPAELQDEYTNNKDPDYLFLAQHSENNEIYGKLRMIPFASLGKENGMLIGFRPDKVEILQQENTLGIENVVVGIANIKLSPDGSYQGLLNPEILDHT